MSRVVRVSVAIVALAVLAAHPAVAQFTSWSDVPADLQPALDARTPVAISKSFDVLTFYNDRETFHAVAPGLPVEDFTGTLVGPAAVGNCAPPLHHATNDACFPTGGVIEGFELDVILSCPPASGSVGDYVIATAGFMGLPMNAVGPHFFCDSTILRFDPPVNAVGLDLIELLTPVNADIAVFDPEGGLMGTDQAVGSTGGAFWGATSSTGIGRVEIVAALDGGELLTNLEFGEVPSISAIPVVGDVGRLLLCLLLAIAGLVVIVLRR